MSDGDLLRQYARTGSRSAFDTLVSRHLTFVHSICMRGLGDRQLAEDATQVVFLVLARKASTLPRTVALSGWLFQTARLTSMDIRRREAVRRKYERAAIAEELRQSPTYPAVWLDIEPVIDAMLERLKTEDRNALLLRFYKDCEFREIASELGISEQAARMRISRALGKIRGWLTEQGIGISAATLLTMLSDPAARFTYPHADLATRILSPSTASSTVAVTKGVLKAIALMQVKAAVTVVATTALIATGVVVYQQTVPTAAPGVVRRPPRIARPHVNADYVGKIVDENGLPVTFAKVVPITFAHGWNDFSTNPNASLPQYVQRDGAFQMMQPPPQFPSALASPPGASQGVMIDASKQVGFAVIRKHVNSTIKLSAPSEVDFTVLDSNRQPIAGATLSPSYVSMNGFTYQTSTIQSSGWGAVTDKSGQAKWTRMPQGATVYGVITAPGYAQASIKLSMLPGVPRITQSMTLARGGYIVGQVRFNGTNRQIAGVTVDAVHYVSIPDEVIATAVTDPSGHFKIGPMPAGAYNINADIPQGQADQGPWLIWQSAPVTGVHVSDGAQTTQNMMFQPRAAIAGTVTDKNGRPVPLVGLRIHNNQTGKNVDVPAINGKLSFGELDAATYTITLYYHRHPIDKRTVDLKNSQTTVIDFKIPTAITASDIRSMQL